MFAFHFSIFFSQLLVLTRIIISSFIPLKHRKPCSLFCEFWKCILNSCSSGDGRQKMVFYCNRQQRQHQCFLNYVSPTTNGDDFIDKWFENAVQCAGNSCACYLYLLLRRSVSVICSCKHKFLKYRLWRIELLHWSCCAIYWIESFSSLSLIPTTKPMLWKQAISVLLLCSSCWPCGYSLSLIYFRVLNVLIRISGLTLKHLINLYYVRTYLNLLVSRISLTWIGSMYLDAGNIQIIFLLLQLFASSWTINHTIFGCYYNVSNHIIFQQTFVSFSNIIF